jgi:tryptophan 2,3-dioxygenase
VVTYSSYLALDEILAAQRPYSDVHDEMLFIVAHQVHEMWFKQLLHEFACLQRQLVAGHTSHALHTLHRSLIILRVVVSPIDVLDTLTPSQFNNFRSALGSASGFQSAQFREIEAVLGRRDRRIYQSYSQDSCERRSIEAAMNRPSVFDSFLVYLSGHGWPVPADRLHRDVGEPLEASRSLQDVLLLVYQQDEGAAQLCERLVELDQALQEWRYRHVSMVERIIGGKPGTGGSTGASYLRTTLFRPMFPDLWAVRAEL